jgi:hypothetical protein
MNSIKSIIDLYALAHGNLKYNVIFGSGSCGINLLKRLTKSGVNVDFFCDNNISKHDTVINGIMCISFEKLKEIADCSLVFVSPVNGESIYKQLEDNKVKYVFPQDLKKAIDFLPETDTNLFPIGHFYSLYPDFAEIEKKSDQIFNKNKNILDIDFNEERQMEILKQMTELYSSIPKWKNISDKQDDDTLRYYNGNKSLSTGDAIGLHCMLRIIKPKKLIEVGSGYTSAITLDTNEYYMDNKIKLSFIEPYPALLNSLLKKSDNIDLQVCGLQDVPTEYFESLESGDILFIDSTHVSKVNSDVNYLFFEILPRLNKGVYIHIHDIFYPFEYPKEWILHTGMVWNELYLLRAFLQNNKNYSIQFFQNMMEQKHMDIFMSKWPYDVVPHGGSIWLRKESK